MASRAQAEFRNQHELALLDQQAKERADATAAAAEQQRLREKQQLDSQGQLNQQQAGLQLGRDYQLAALQERQRQMDTFHQGQLNTQQAGFQQQRDTQQFQQQGQLAEQHGDIQARLNQTMLTQNEQMRMAKMQNAISDVKANPGLSPDEKANLITQLQTGLNPLQNRHTEAQTLQTQIAAQAQAQQAQQSAQLFNQHQSWLARGIQGQLQTVTDPNTGIQQLFHVGANGDIRPMDFSQAAQMHELRMQQGQVGIASEVQGMGQRQQLFPGQLQHQSLANQQMAQTMDFARQMQPGNVQHQALVNQNIVQHIAQGADLHPGVLQMQGAQLADLTQRTAQAAQMNPSNLRLLNANVQLAEQNVAQGPAAFASQQEYRAAQTALTRAHDTQIRAQVAQMPRILEMQQQAHNGTISHQAVQNEQIRAQTALLQLQAQEGLPPQVAVHLYDTVSRAVDHEASNPDSAINQSLRRQFPGNTPEAANRRQQGLAEYQRTEVLRRINEGMPTIRSLFQPGRLNNGNGGGAVGAAGALGAATQPNTPPPAPFVVPTVNSPAHAGMMQALDQLNSGAGRLSGEARTRAMDEIRQARLILQAHAGREMPANDRARYEALMQRLRQLPSPLAHEGPSPDPLSYMPIGG